MQKALGVRGPLEEIQCRAAVSLQGLWREWTDVRQEVQIVQTVFFFFFCIVVSVIIIVMLYVTILRGHYFKMRKNDYCLVNSIVNCESKVKRNVTDQVVAPSIGLK